MIYERRQWKDVKPWDIWRKENRRRRRYENVTAIRKVSLVQADLL